MPLKWQRLALPAEPDLTVESPCAPITIPPAACLLEAHTRYTSPMQPTSAPRYEYIAARTRRKWGELSGGELMVALDGVLGVRSIRPSVIAQSVRRQAVAAEWLEARRLKAQAIVMA
jgi:hypothetical protein